MAYQTKKSKPSEKKSIFSTRLPRGPTVRWDIAYDRLFENRRKNK